MEFKLRFYLVNSFKQLEKRGAVLAVARSFRIDHRLSIAGGNTLKFAEKRPLQTALFKRMRQFRKGMINEQIISRILY